MINIQRIATKSAVLLIIAIGLIAPSAACLPTSPNTAPPLKDSTPSSSTSTPSPAPAPPAEQQTPAGTGVNEISNSENISPLQPARSVEIMMIHHRGTLTRIGCCNPDLYERDEFVVIQNRSGIPQDITGWSLTNITRGYPTFRFPPLFPCLPYVVPPEDDVVMPESTYKFVRNPAQSVINSLSPPADKEKPTNEPAGEIDWSSCNPVDPPDQTPMKPAEGGQGKPVPCILYPGQTVLVFTDEVHCSSGGFSFNWGQGNIWNNEIPDTAVLYNSEGIEISRRSYTVGR